MPTPLVRPIAYKNESPGSILLRSSFENGWQKPSAIISAYTSYKVEDERGLIALFTNFKKWEETCDQLSILNENDQIISYPKTGYTKS